MWVASIAKASVSKARVIDSPHLVEEIKGSLTKLYCFLFRVEELLCTLCLGFEEV